jgi:hypothetical protein
MAAADDAQAAISLAESRLHSAYGKVLLAEEAGANVSTLLSKLNSCADLLSQAHTSYRGGNSSEALSFADQCIAGLGGVEAEAGSLHDKAVSDGILRLVVSGGISAIAIEVAVFLFAFGWLFFRDRYSARVMGMRLEVQADEPS